MQGKIKEPDKNKRGKIIGYHIIGEDGQPYYAHLGDLQESENLLYDIRDHKLGPLDIIYDRFDKTMKDMLAVNQNVEFEEWNGNSESKRHAFNVKIK